MATSNSDSDNDLYTAEAVSYNGAVSVDGASPDRLTVRASQELGGPDGGWNPERLYAAALATCLHQSIVLVGSTTGADTGGSAVHAEVTLREHRAESYKMDAAMHVELPGVADAATRERILAQATTRCPLVDESQVTVS